MRWAFTGFANAKRRNWHPYNPHAERDARIAAEGLYTDSLTQVTTFDDADERQGSSSNELNFDL